MDIARLLQEAQSGVTDLDKTVTSLQEELRANKRMLADLQNENVKLSAMQDASVREIQSLSLQLQQEQVKVAEQDQRLKRPLHERLNLTMPTFTMLKPEDPNYVHMNNGLVENGQWRDDGAAARKMVEEQPRSRVLTELLSTQQWSLTKISGLKIYFGPDANVNEKEDAPTADMPDRPRADSGVAVTDPSKQYKTLPGHRPVCTKCWRSALHCTSEAPCQYCIGLADGCKYKFCNIGIDCTRPKCHYVHPGQNKYEGIARNVEHGSLGTYPKTNGGDKKRKAPEGLEQPPAKKHLSHLAIMAAVAKKPQ